MRSKTLVKTIIGIVVIGGGLGYFMYQAMQSSWSYYYSVDEFSSNSSVVKGNSFRIAGKVKPESISKDLEKTSLSFMLAGSNSEVPVVYSGAVPDNFEDDIEVVVEGRLDAEGVFRADTLMTRCESKYKAKVN
jgi:cytochrome c-type biogenesis protein CcmE